MHSSTCNGAVFLAVSSLAFATLLACGSEVASSSGGAPATIDGESSADAGSSVGEGGTEVPKDTGADASPAPPCLATTDLTSNADHCGRCGHSCAGGMCNGGVCQILDLVTTATATSQLAMDAHKLYFWGEGAGGYGIRSIPKIGGSPVVVLLGQAGQQNVDLRIDGGSLYWSEGDKRFYRTSLSTGTTTQSFTSTYIMKDFDVGAGKFFVTTFASLLHAPTNGPSATTLIDYDDTAQYESGKVRTNGTYIAYAYQASLMRAKVDGSDVRPLAAGLAPAAMHVAIDASDVYYATGTTIERVSLTSGMPPQTIASGLQDIKGIALDAANVYFTTMDDIASKRGSLRVVPKTGGAVGLLVNRTPYPEFVAVDDSAVYFATPRFFAPGSVTNYVSKIAKP